MSIVCTGYGIIAPQTVNVQEFLFNLQRGINCLELNNELTPHNETNIVGIVKKGLEELDADKRLKRLPKVAKLGMIAAKEAIQSAKLDVTNKKIGLFIGVSLGAGGESVFQDSIIYANQNKYRKIPITFSHFANYHSITASIAHFIGTKGITKTITTGCTSSLEAIEEAMAYLKSGMIDIAIVGGTDSPISKATTFAFAKTRTIPIDQGLEDGAVPFQQGSAGFAMSEGSGIIILERADEAIKRGAHIIGEIEKVSSNTDGGYIFDLDDTGNQMVNALKEVTEGRNPDYINSQALGIRINDNIEKRCSKELFDHSVPYTSIKSMYGNPFGVAGVMQVIASLLSIQHNFIPPTIRTTKKGYEEMKIVTGTRYQTVDEVAITNHGYGGNNACAYVKRYIP